MCVRSSLGTRAGRVCLTITLLHARDLDSILAGLSASLSLWPGVFSSCSERMNTHDKTLCEAEIPFSE